MRALASSRLAAAGFLTTVAVSMNPAPAAAQEAAPAMIPRDVAEALIGGSPFLDGDRDVRILVGRMPDDLVRLVPAEPGAQVVGSLVRQHMTEAVLDLPGTPDEVLTRWEEGLRGMGWEPIRPTALPSTGGFTSPPPGRSHQFCQGDSLTVSLNADRRDGASRLRILLPRSRSAYNVCRHQEDQARFRRLEESPLPLLTPPPGVRMRGGGSGGGGADFVSRAMAETELGIEELAEHYHRQLVASGWEVLGQAAGDDVVVYRYRVPDEERDSPWLGLLSVVEGHDPEERYLGVEARRGERW